MRTLLRLAVAAVLAGALAVPAAVIPATAADPETNSAATGDRDAALRALAAVEEALAPAAQRVIPTRRRLGDPLPRRDLTLLLRDLAVLAAKLPPAAQARAARYLRLPADGQCHFTDSIDSDHFRVSFENGNDQQAQRTVAVLEEVWRTIVDRMGYRKPITDEDGLFDIALCDTGAQGYYGYCVPDHVRSHTSTAYCILDDDFSVRQFGSEPDVSLRATAAHEFFHAVQYAYDVLEDRWFMEGTAVWMETQAYPQITDYEQFLEVSALTKPTVPIDTGPRTVGDPQVYGSVLFWIFLGERYGAATIRDTWRRAVGAPYSLRAVNASLTARRIDPKQAYALFGVWNTKPAGSYAKRSRYPTQRWWLDATLTRKRKKLTVRSVRLPHLTTAAAVIRPKSQPKGGVLQVRVDGPDLDRQPQATVQIRNRDGSAAIRHIALNNHGDATVTVPFDQRAVSSIVVGLTNASTRARCRVGTIFSCAGSFIDDRTTYALSAQVKKGPRPKKAQQGKTTKTGKNR